MTSLSPQARAVLDAFCAEARPEPHHQREAIAAVLKAAADQVVPWRPEPTEESVGLTVDFGYAWALFSKTNDVRQEFLAIADELKRGLHTA
jgi:hypothetical protein